MYKNDNRALYALYFESYYRVNFMCSESNAHASTGDVPAAVAICRATQHNQRTSHLVTATATQSGHLPPECAQGRTRTTPSGGARVPPGEARELACAGKISRTPSGTMHASWRRRQANRCPPSHRRRRRRQLPRSVTGDCWRCSLLTDGRAGTVGGPTAEAVVLVGQAATPRSARIQQDWLRKLTSPTYEG